MQIHTLHMAHVEIDLPCVSASSKPSRVMARATTSRGASSSKRMIALHEALAAIVAKISSFAPQRLRDAENAVHPERKCSRMELIELHVRKFGTGLKSQRNPSPVATSGFGGIAIYLPRARPMRSEPQRALILFRARCCALPQTSLMPVQLRSRDRLHISSFVTIVHSANLMRGCACACATRRSTDLRAGGIPVGVQNPRPRVRPFARAEQPAGFAVKAGAPVDEFRQLALGPFGNQHFGSRSKHQTIPAEMVSSKMKRQYPRYLRPQLRRSHPERSACSIRQAIPW